MSRKLPKSVKPDEFKRLIGTLKPKDNLFRVAFLLAYGSGLRVSEVVNLKKENVFDRHLEIWGGKGGVDRTVPTPKGWKDFMKKYLPIDRSIRTLERKFKQCSLKAGLPDYYSFHSLRHGFATRLVEAGVPISHIQVLLGHSNISVTSIYTKARPEDALKSYEELF